MYETKCPTEEQNRKYIRTEEELTKQDTNSLQSFRISVEIDEYDHEDRDIGCKIERQKALEKELGCKFMKINLDQENFNIFKAINEIFRHIKESNKKSTEESTKKSLVDELSNKLLKLVGSCGKFL